MDVYTYEERSHRWEAAPNPLQGLRDAAGAGQEVLLVSACPVRELADLQAAVWLVERLTGGLDRLSVASPYPALAWIVPLRQAGVRRLFAVSSGAVRARRLDPGALVEVPPEPCPLLTVSDRSGEGLCVCGQHRHGRVLTTDHFAHRCFAAWSTCAAREAESPPGRERCGT